MMKIKSKWEIEQIIQEREGEELCTAFPSSISLSEDGTWKVWYSIFFANPKPYCFGYLTGKLGENFTKSKVTVSSQAASEGVNIIGIPKEWGIVQPIWIKLRSGKERIYFWAHAKGIARFLAADSKDGINFLVEDIARPCLYHPNDKAVSINTLNTASLTVYTDRHMPASNSEPEAPRELICNDATTVYMLDDGTFELYTVRLLPTTQEHRGYVEHDPGKGVLRVIERRTSLNGIEWSPGQQIMAPDENDPDDLQFYYLAVTHTPVGRIGILGYYRTQRGTMDLEFCFSRDGINWERKFRGASFPRDSGTESIYAPCSMVEKNGRYYLFSTFYSFTHHEGHNIRDEYTSKIVSASIDSKFLNAQMTSLSAPAGCIC